MTPLQCRRDPTIRHPPTVVRSVRAMATFRPTPFGALAASAKDLPASFNAASNACGHRAHLISAISVADISGDNARWAGWRALALRQPAGPIAPTARIGAAPSAIVVARCRDVCQMVEVCAPGIAFGLGSERRQPFGGLEPIAWGRWQAVPEAAAPRFAHPVGGDNSGANGMERDVITDLVSCNTSYFVLIDY